MSYERHKFKFDTEVIFVLLILALEAVVLLAVVFHVIEGKTYCLHEYINVEQLLS